MTKFSLKEIYIQCVVSQVPKAAVTVYIMYLHKLLTVCFHTWKAFTIFILLHCCTIGSRAKCHNSYGVITIYARICGGNDSESSAVD